MTKAPDKARVQSIALREDHRPLIRNFALLAMANEVKALDKGDCDFHRYLESLQNLDALSTTLLTC